MDIRSMNLEEMEALAISLGEKAFRGKQLFQWVHEKQADDFDEMTNLSAAFREKLKENYCISGVRQVEKQVSKKEDTAKYLFALEDDHVIESVWMKYRHGNSVCISSQVGCRMGCTFCASTLTGLTRNLTAGEMLSQIYQIQKDTKERVSNIIVMGMGEPLDNYEELLRFIKLVSCEKGIGISQRNITVSTCGLVDKIRMLADEKLQITLAISLHAPNDEIRRQTMPIANRYTIGEIIQACKYYFDKTGRRITFEYSMIRGVNDKEEHAKELAEEIGTKKVVVKIKSGEGGRIFGSVSTKEIAQAAKEQAGLDLDKKKMQLGESIKALGTYEIPVKLHPKVTATLRVQVVEE